MTRRRAWRTAGSGYQIDAKMAYILPWLFPMSIVFPATFALPLANALTVPRLFLFFTIYPTIREIYRKLTGGGYVPVLSDVMVILMTMWMVIVIVIHQGPKGLIGFGSLSAIEFAAGYFMARVFFGTPIGFNQFTRVLPIVVGLVLATALVDTASGQALFAKIGQQMTGGPPVEPFPKRFGLVRAQGSLEHPILLGIFFVMSSVLLFFSDLKPLRKVFWIGVCLFAMLLPLSSAPILSMTMAFGLILLLNRVKNIPWATMMIFLVGIFFVASFMILVDNPVLTLINNLTLDPQTGVFRTLIWKWALLNIERAPLIGIGFDDWMRAEDMPTSIDSLYLVQAIRFGIPALALLVLALLTTGVTMQSRPLVRYPNPAIDFIRTGLGVCIFIILFNAFTVHFWGADWVLLAIVMGMRAGMTEASYMPPFMRGEERGQST
ncbi:hypothetical protein ASG25_02995 [Rhizobium sp. Leaf384]|nr:hypothetical protein ASG25_02995 [Rhizobium sp. Leaf384]KQS82209.1 hypothetical protein ASG58_22525 [Rhizobium sp. Leaf383]